MSDEKLKDLGVEPITPPSASKGKSKSKSSSKSKSASSTDLNITQLKRAVERQFELFGMLLSGYDSYDGQVIAEKAPDLADALIELAKTHRPVRRFLEKMVATGAYSTVIALVGGEIMMPIAVHHQWLPEPINNAIAESQGIPLREKKERVSNEDKGSDGIRLVSDGERNQETDTQSRPS